MFIYFERQRASQQGRGREREREREREKILNRLHTVSEEPDVGLEPMIHEIMT